jgi:hypothetical protein
VPGKEICLWVFNLLPLSGLVWFFHTMSLPEILGSLGFGVGVAITMTVLAIIFIKGKIPGGFVVNLLLVGFVFLSYSLPRFDALDPRGNHGWFFGCLVACPIVQALMVMLLIVYLLNKPGTFESPSTLLNYYFKPPVLIGFLGAFAGLLIQRAGILKFSTAFASAQFLAWFWVWITLCVLGVPAQMDFAELHDLIIQEKRVWVNVRQSTVIYAFLALLLMCTIFEAFRGLWLLWGLSGLWSIFMFASLWRVWGFAFQAGEGTGWHYFETLGNFLESVRTRMRQIELQNEADLSSYYRSHATSISAILISFFLMVLLLFQTYPVLFFIALFAIAVIINYFLKDALKRQGICLSDKVPFSVGMTFALMTVTLFFLLYLVIFVVKQIFAG